MSEKKLNSCFLVLGSNKGHRASNLKRAIKYIAEEESITVIASSSLYITKPWGYRRQHNFYNVAVKIETALPPKSLLQTLESIENKIGKQKKHHLGPRKIDIDIGIYDDLIIEEEGLTIPHKDLLKRDFFLKPIIEIDKNVVEPKTKKKLEYYLKKIEREYIIKKLKIKMRLNEF
jgi:2-amino-4-hydroxy-6-hydroxymethyldihydropteridine diphosphokinase